MEKEEFLKIKEAVLKNEKSGVITTYDGNLHTYDPEELLNTKNMSDILKIFYRTKEITLKLSESNLRWVNDYALLTLVDLLDSKFRHSEDVINEWKSKYTNEVSVKEQLMTLLEENKKTIDSLNDSIQDYEKEKLIMDTKGNDELKELQNKLKECEDQLNSNIEQNNSLIAKYEKLKGENDDNIKTIEALNKKIVELQNTTEEYAKAIAEINDSIVMANNKTSDTIKKMTRIGNKFESGPNIGI